MAKDTSPWALFGEGMIGFARHRRRRFSDLPKGMHRVPGPIVILAERFVDSPAGPFVCLSIGEPVRVGLRIGMHFGISVINSEPALKAGEEHWGFPHELGSLRWWSEAGVRSVVWAERDIQVRATIKGRPLPLLFPVSSLQARAGGPVVVPSRFQSLVRRSSIEVIITDPDDPLAPLAGRHRGFTLSGLAMHRRAVKRATGWLNPLRGVLKAPEPGVAGMPTSLGRPRRSLTGSH